MDGAVGDGQRMEGFEDGKGMGEVVDTDDAEGGG